MTKQTAGLPDSLQQMLAAADQRNGLPSGTMASVMRQEVGGNFQKYLDDPSTYHYGLNADGKRIAGHTGKVSTAFGPFGILESTGAQPGYGVAPLKDKSLGEQIRFASEYLAARSKQAGGLEQGLAGYGEGAKYGAQVASRVGAGRGVVNPPVVQAGEVVTASAPTPVDQRSTVEGPSPTAVSAAQEPVVVAQGPDPWDRFRTAVDRPPVQAADLAYGQATQPGMGISAPNFMGSVQMPQARADFRSLAGFGLVRGRA